MSLSAPEAPAPLALRAYQRDATTAFRSATARGVRRGVINLPTGTGKTVTALALAREHGGRVLWLAHREELLAQALRTALDLWPGVAAGVVQAERDETDARDLVLASVATVSRTIEDGALPRLDRVLAAGAPSLVVVDEAHHAVAATYRRVLERVGAFAPGGPVVLGLTATLERGDERALSDVWERVVYQLSLVDAIREGYLAPIAPPVRVVLPELDLDAIDVRDGDFVERDLGDALLRAHVVEHVANAVLEHASDRRTIVFCTTVAQADETAAALVARGLRAALVSGDLAPALRRERLDAFARGDLDAVTNCAVLTEGYDNPGVSCVVVARPTRAKGLYLQMVGRGTRLAPGKENLLIIDVAGASEVHSLMSAPVLFGLGEADVADERDGREREADAPSARSPLAGLMAGPTAPLPVSWVRVPGFLAYAGSATRGVDVLVRAPVDRWLVEVARRGEALDLVGSYGDLELALGVGADVVRRLGGTRLHTGARYWRSRPATEAQLGAAARWRLHVPEGATAGTVGDMLTAASAAARLRKLGRGVTVA